MADLIQIKAGSGEVPKLLDRELGYSKTEKALYIGTETENVKLATADDVETVARHEIELKDYKSRLEALEARIALLENT